MLKKEGFNPWMDKVDLRSGSLWKKEIPQVIKQSRFVIIFFSNHSISKRGYVQTEFKLALKKYDISLSLFVQSVSISENLSEYRGIKNLKLDFRDL